MVLILKFVQCWMYKHLVCDCGAVFQCGAMFCLGSLLEFVSHLIRVLCSLVSGTSTVGVS